MGQQQPAQVQPGTGQDGQVGNQTNLPQASPDQMCGLGDRLLAAMDSLGQRLDQQSAQCTAQIAGINDRLDRQAAAFDTQLVAMGNRMDCQLAAMRDQLDHRVDGQIAKLESRVSGKVAELGRQIDGEVAGLERRIECEISSLRDEFEARLAPVSTSTPYGPKQASHQGPPTLEHIEPGSQGQDNSAASPELFSSETGPQEQGFRNHATEDTSGPNCSRSVTGSTGSQTGSAGSKGPVSSSASQHVGAAITTGHGPHSTKSGAFASPKVTVTWADETIGCSLAGTPSENQTKERHEVKVNRNPVRLPEFSGKPGESLQTFLNQMTNGARLGAWTPDYKVGMLYAQLRAGALHYADSLVEGDRQDFDRFVAALRRQYEGNVARERAKEALRTIRRGRNESLVDLGHRITELVRKAYPAEQREDEAVWALRNAVSDKMAEHIVLQHFVSMEECLNALTRLECHIEMRNRTQGRISQVSMASERGEGGAPSRKDQGAQRKESTSPTKSNGSKTAQGTTTVTGPAPLTMEDLQKALKSVLEAGGRRPQTQGGRKRSRQAGGQGENRTGPSAERPCNTCGAEDHWASDCPKRARQGNAPGLTPPRSGGQSNE